MAAVVVAVRVLVVVGSEVGDHSTNLRGGVVVGVEALALAPVETVLNVVGVGESRMGRTRGRRRRTVVVVIVTVVV